MKLPFKRWTYELIDQLIIHFIKPGKGGGLLMFRLDLLGDYLMCRPFFKSLQTSGKFKNYKISFAGNQMLKELAPALDSSIFEEFIWIERQKFINSISYRFRILSEIRRRGFEVILNPTHTRQYWLESVIRVSGAAQKITSRPVGKYMNDWEQCLSDGWYTTILPTSENPQFEFLRNRDFFRMLSSDAASILTPADDFFTTDNRRQNMILAAPGASTPERRWPEEQFARLLDRLAELFPGFSFGLTGSAAEVDLCQRIALKCTIAEPEIFAGSSSLLQSMQLLSTSRLLIANESGPVHMAATTATDCVCISNGNHFGRWNPFPEELAPRIMTCYPEDFYPLDVKRNILMEKYYTRSEIPASAVLFSRVLEACLNLLANGSERQKAIG